MDSEPDSDLHRKAMSYIRRHSIKPELWEYTLIGTQHPQVRDLIDLEPGELVLISSYISMESWYLFTTRRVVSRRGQRTADLPSPSTVIGNFGNFKGYDPKTDRFGAQRTEVATVKDLKSGATLQFEFETGNASMAPMYACKFWERRARQEAATKRRESLKHGTKDA